MRVSRTISRVARGVGMLALAASLGTGCARNNADERTAPPAGNVMGPAGVIHVEDGGSGGVPVVFIHSFAGNSGHWTGQLEHLRTSRRAIAIDLRGHGQSSAPDSGGYAVDSLASDIAAVVDQLGLQRFVLVGHSLGGAAAIAYAAKHPDRVAGMVLVGTPGKSSPEMAQQVLTSMEANYDTVMAGFWNQLLEGGQPDVQSRIHDETTSVPRTASLEIISAIFAYDPLPDLQAYTGPKMLIDTTHGESPGALHNLAPEIPRRQITGTSHWPHLDKPDEFNAALDSFLGGVS